LLFQFYFPLSIFLCKVSSVFICEGLTGKRANGPTGSTFYNVSILGGLQRSHWALDGVLKPLLVLCPANKLQNSTKGFQTAAGLF
jgi:hypothetical protein